MNPNILTAEQRVEAYLDHILAPLSRSLSLFHQAELRRELRAHLRGRVDAYRELDYSEDDAVTEALKQFGSAEDFLKQWRREWMQAARPDVQGGLWQATLTGLRLSVPALTLACGPVILWVSQAAIYGHSHPWLKSWLEGNADWFGPVIAWTDFVILPALLGIAIGRRSPRRAGSGAFLALVGEIVVGAVLDGFGLKHWPRLPVISDVLGQAALLEFTWLPTACLFAAFTGWWTQRGQKKRRIA